MTLQQYKSLNREEVEAFLTRDLLRFSVATASFYKWSLENISEEDRILVFTNSDLLAFFLKLCENTTSEQEYHARLEKTWEEV